jgi:hypothetical protein
VDLPALSNLADFAIVHHDDCVFDGRDRRRQIHFPTDERDIGSGALVRARAYAYGGDYEDNPQS